MSVGELCEGDGSCGTSEAANNCAYYVGFSTLKWEVYRLTSVCAAAPSPPLPPALPPLPPRLLLPEALLAVPPERAPLSLPPLQGQTPPTSLQGQDKLMLLLLLLLAIIVATVACASWAICKLRHLRIKKPALIVMAAEAVGAAETELETRVPLVQPSDFRATAHATVIDAEVVA